MCVPSHSTRRLLWTNLANNKTNCIISLIWIIHIDVFCYLGSNIYLYLFYYILLKNKYEQTCLTQYYKLCEVFFGWLSLGSSLSYRYEHLCCCVLGQKTVECLLTKLWNITMCWKLEESLSGEFPFNILSQSKIMSSWLFCLDTFPWPDTVAPALIVLQWICQQSGGIKLNLNTGSPHLLTIIGTNKTFEIYCS